jgi:hypothetical protein
MEGILRRKQQKPVSTFRKNHQGTLEKTTKALEILVIFSNI